MLDIFGESLLFFIMCGVVIAVLCVFANIEKRKNSKKKKYFRSYKDWKGERYE